MTTCCHCLLFFFTDTATTEIYTLSLHDALPISRASQNDPGYSIRRVRRWTAISFYQPHGRRDRKSTRLNSSHVRISYAVFCLKKKKKELHNPLQPQIRAALELSRVLALSIRSLL